MQLKVSLKGMSSTNYGKNHRLGELFLITVPVPGPKLYSKGIYLVIIPRVCLDLLAPFRITGCIVL